MELRCEMHHGSYYQKSEFCRDLFLLLNVNEKEYKMKKKT